MNSHAGIRKTFMGFVNIIVIMCLGVFFLYFYLYRGNIVTTSTGLVQNAFIYSIIYGLFIYIFELYKIGNIRLVDVFCGQVFAIIITDVIFLIQLGIVADSIEEVKPDLFLVVTGVQFLLGLVMGYFVHQMYMKVVLRRKLLAVVSTNPDDTILENITRFNQYYEVQEVISVDRGVDKIIEKAKTYEGLLVGALPVSERNMLVRRCFIEGIQVFYMLKISDILVGNSKKYKIYDQIMLMNHNQGLSWWQRGWKRFFDIIFSIIFIILSAPLCIVIMILIKCEDGGHIFYKQLRVTKGGREFYIYKFRSMKEDAESNGAQLAKKEDTRITKVGRVIRNLHFDELPQLFNVLKGDMSLVGPRPERRIFIEQYKKIVPEFESRLKVKAGLTGYAQIYGKYNTNPYDKLKLDLMYINNYSVFLDIKLLFQTVRILFQKENTEGVNEDQVSALSVTDQRKI